MTTPELKQMEVTIMGSSYILGCPEGEQGKLLAAVEAVDREMCAIRDARRVRARERVAVLAALNLAFRLADRPAPAAASAGSDTVLPLPAQIDALVRRVDDALGNDGRLL